MSYARFSSDDWKSDVYVYECDEGIAVHVAANRHVMPDDLPAPVVLSSPPTAEEIDACLRRSREVMHIVDNAPTVRIDLPGAGESHLCDEPSGALALLKNLSESGFHVPQHALDTLADEAAEQDGGEVR